MMKPGQDAELALETIQRCGFQPLHGLEGDQVLAFAVIGAVHNPHPAAAQFGQNLVTGKGWKPAGVDRSSADGAGDLANRRQALLLAQQPLMTLRTFKGYSHRHSPRSQLPMIRGCTYFIATPALVGWIISYNSFSRGFGAEGGLMKLADAVVHALHAW